MFYVLRHKLQTERWSFGSMFEMLTEAYDKAWITKSEFLELLETPINSPIVNAPGGAC